MGGAAGERIAQQRPRARHLATVERRQPFMDAAREGRLLMGKCGDTGKLFYDADGSGSGAKVLVAILTGNPVFTAADIFVT